jgi:type I restriction enzyme S subunit
MRNGWEAKKLGEVCSFLNRGISPKYVEKGGVVVLNQRCVRDHGVNFKVARRHDIKAKAIRPERFVQVGDVLINSTGVGTLGRVAQLRGDLPEPTTVDSHVTIVRPVPGLFFTEFFGYVLRDIEEELQASGEGCGGQTELNRSVLAEKFVVRFPVAISEQQRIVGVLDEAFEGLATAKANAEKNLQNARTLFESHLQSVFNQRDKGWAEQRLGDVVTRLTNGYVGPTRNIYHDSGVPYLLARHVKDNHLQFDGKTFITEEFNRKNKKSMLKTGDVLLVQSGHIGHSAVVTEEHEGHNCHAMIVITAAEGAFIGPFLSLFFNSSTMKQKFQEIRSGSTVPHLTCGEVKELQIPLPDLKTQRNVVDHSRELSQEIKRLAAIYEQKLAALEALKKSLLHHAFSGHL